MSALPAGCRFAARCPFVSDICVAAPPPLVPSQSRSLVALHQGAARKAGVVTALLEVKDLARRFVARRSMFGRPTAHVNAVDGVSFAVEAGKTLALVGESGCGKSTVSRLVLRLIEPDAGSIRFEGRDLLAMDAGQLRAFRREAQIIFQDPYASLNPRMTVNQILSEPLALHDLVPSAQRRARVEELLKLVGLGAAPCPALSARILRRPAPAHRDRARARGRAEADHLRRAGVGAGCLDPLADPQSAARSAEPARAGLHLRLARSCRGQAHRRPRRRDEFRPHRRDRRRADAVRRAAPSLQPRAAVGDPDAQSAGQAQPHFAAGRNAERARSAGRLPFPYPLSLCRRALPHRAPAACCRAGRPCHRLPPHGGTACAAGNRSLAMPTSRPSLERLLAAFTATRKVRRRRG